MDILPQLVPKDYHCQVACQENLKVDDYFFFTFYLVQPPPPQPQTYVPTSVPPNPLSGRWIFNLNAIPSIAPKTLSSLKPYYSGNNSGLRIPIHF
jgi:hypothetical protein